MLRLLLESANGLVPHRFKNIRLALQKSHENNLKLYEEDDDEPNLLYCPTWDIPTKRAVWRHLLGGAGFSAYRRDMLPDDLIVGTSGPDFEAR